MNLRYSSRVVAPTVCNSPCASAGFNMLLASMAPSAAPAPTNVWISSMKRIISPLDCRTSSITAFRRSSNSPRNLVPATNAPMSSAMTLRPFNELGTSSAAIFWARPSAMAVLPTPASPTITGLFLVRRVNTCATRLISFSRPMTGSSFPCRAISVRSRPYFCRERYLLSARASVTLCPPRNF